MSDDNDVVIDVEDDGNNNNEDDDGGEYGYLFEKKIKEVDMKDLYHEVQSKKDISKFVNKANEAVIMLNISASSAKDFTEKITNELIDKDLITKKQSKQIKSDLLTEEPISRVKNVVQQPESNSSMVGYVNVPGLLKPIFVLSTLSSPANLQHSNGQLEELVILILGPPDAEIQGTQSVLESARTFATLLTHDEVRYDLKSASNEDDVIEALEKFLDELDSDYLDKKGKKNKDDDDDDDNSHQDQNNDLKCSKRPVGGIWFDIQRRLPWYFSDFKDGFIGDGNVRKLFSTTFFLYFACILPAIAFGVLNHTQTNGNMDVRKTILAQGIGGIIFALFGGQPLIVLLTTAPIALYMKVIYTISVQSGFNFYALYGWVGFWTAFFLVVYSLTEASVLMKFSTRFSEETFGFFISIAFAFDAIKPLFEEFLHSFYGCGDDCHRDASMLFLFLLIGTVLLGYWLWNFKSSPLLNPTLREFLSAYSLPISVLIMTIVGSGILYPVEDEPFVFDEERHLINIAPLTEIPIWGIFVAAGLGFILSLLFFMDQNISSAMVNAPDNHLKKGHAYHLDMYVVAIITAWTSYCGLPWIHAALPHSPLHVRAQADLENIYIDGAVEQRIVRVRETRLTGLFSHALIVVSLLAVPTPMQVIPVPVLYGVFLYLSVTALPGNQFWQRLLLFITQKSNYEPYSFIRRVPSNVIHAFTFIQVLCLLFLCFFGFIPVDYIQMFLPVAIIVLIPFRHLVIGKLFPKRYLDALDPRMMSH